MSRWSCPGCDAPLQFSEEGLDVTWTCQPCLLTWVTRESYSSSLVELTYPNQLVTRLEHSRPSERDLTCPQCRQQTFRTISVGPMEIEICSQCRGLVLDPGETVFAISNKLDPFWDVFWRHSWSTVKLHLILKVTLYVVLGIALLVMYVSR